MGAWSWNHKLLTKYQDHLQILTLLIFLVVIKCLPSLHYLKVCVWFLLFYILVKPWKKYSINIPGKKYIFTTFIQKNYIETTKNQKKFVLSNPGLDGKINIHPTKNIAYSTLESSKQKKMPNIPLWQSVKSFLSKKL